MSQNKTDEGVDIRRSSGHSKTGVPIFYARPAMACENRSRRFMGYDKLAKGIKKWFTPAVYYLVDGHLIGSNSIGNALKEYHRICEVGKIGKQFEVIINSHE